MIYDNGGKVLIWPKTERKIYTYNGRMDLEANGGSRGYKIRDNIPTIFHEIWTPLLDFLLNRKESTFDFGS